jgi:iron-sulfur cluster repair protein YtfE (RIC family)
VENEKDFFNFLDEVHLEIDKNLMWISKLIAEVDIQDLTTNHKKQLERVCRFFDLEVRQHHVDEEKYVFPSLLLQHDQNLAELTRKLFVDHERFEQSWRKLSEMFKAVLLGTEWFSTQELSHEFNEFHVLNLKHMKLEESHWRVRLFHI